MAELQETLEYIDGRAASASALFGGEGRAISSAARARSKAANPEYMATLIEVARICAGARKGNPWDEYRLKEAMSTSDFPLYFGDILDRTLITKYRSIDPLYQRYAQVRELRDFRTANIFAFDGAQAQLDVVPELTEYPGAVLSETRYQIAVAKHGRRIPVSWEAIVNDDQNIFNDIPSRFADSSNRSKEKDVAKLFVDASGPHATLFNNTNKNLVNIANGAASNNPTLSISGIQEGLKVLARQVDADGEPIIFDSLELVVPLALGPTADQIIKTTEYLVLDTGTASNLLPSRRIGGNGIGTPLRVSINPYISSIGTTNGTTSWFLFATPYAGVRTALIYANLRGHVGPEMFVKDPDQRRLGGGGDIAPLEGDFDTDAIQYKVRDTWGTARGDPKTAVASNGSGA
jgi:hypothetical protein